MKAGIDFGSTLTKAVWMVGSCYRFASTADTKLEEIVNEMKSDGVKRLYVAGIGYEKLDKTLIKGLEIKANSGDAIENEIQLQGMGARRIMELEGIYLDKFLLVSIGTGTSYSFVDRDRIRRFPIGNSISGGFIKALGEVLGAKDYTEIRELASKGTPLDLLIKDMLPEKEGTIEGNLTIASFGKVNSSSDIKDIYASLVNCVAVMTSHDLMLMAMVKGYNMPNDIVYIGSTISSKVFKNLLSRYTHMAGRVPYFPKNGQFALAMGAYLTYVKSEKCEPE